jgi:thiol:disulfide interchange protein DsbD
VFRTDHDQDAVKVGPGRILSGSLFLFLALFAAPALFGRPPQSPIWDRLVVGMLPADAGELRSMAVAEAGSGCKKEDATSNDPKVAIRQQKDCHGVSWGMSLDAALEQARAENKPVLIDFTGVNCANCRLMEANVLPKADVVPLLSRFVTVQLYTDIVPIKSITADQREALAGENQDLLKELANESTNPFYVVLSPDRKVLETIGFSEPRTFAGFLKKALAKHQDDKKVAQVDVTPGR